MIDQLFSILLDKDSVLWIGSYSFCLIFTIISMIFFIVVAECWAKLLSRKVGYYDYDNR